MYLENDALADDRFAHEESGDELFGKVGCGRGVKVAHAGDDRCVSFVLGHSEVVELKGLDHDWDGGRRHGILRWFRV